MQWPKYSQPRSLNKETLLTPAPRSDSKCQALIGASAAAATEPGDAAACIVLTYGYLLALALVATVVENPTAWVARALGEDAVSQSKYHWVVMLAILGSTIGFGVCCWVVLRWRSRRNVLNVRLDHAL